MRSQETTYQEEVSTWSSGTLPCALEVGATKRNQQKELVVSQKQSEERFQKKSSPTSNTTATSSEIRNEDQRENLSPRTSLVISTRAVTTAEEKNLMAVDPKGTVSTAAHKNSLGE